MKLGANPLLVAGIVLMLAACGLLALAKYTPWHTDSNAYFAGLVTAESDAKAFYANLHRFETHKWLYADLGYAAAAWSGAILGLSMLVDVHGWRVLTTTNANPRAIVAMTLAACALVLAGLIGQGLQQIGRWEVYDGSIGPMNFGAAVITVGMVLGTLIFLAANFVPLVWKPVAGGRLCPTKPIGPILIFSLLYAPFLLLPGYLLVASFFGPGGWGMSIGAVIAIWLILNAHALAVSTRARRKAHQISPTQWGKRREAEGERQWGCEKALS